MQSPQYFSANKSHLDPQQLNYCIHYYNATDHPIDTNDINFSIKPYLIIACMPKEALAQQSFKTPFTSTTFYNTLVITAKPGNKRHSH